MIGARSLTRRFGENTILDRLDLTIGPAEFVALLGASGSGKTTLLRIFAGLDAEFDGMLETPAERAVVFQEARLLPWKRVRDNVTLGLRDADAHQRGADALAEVGLAHRADAWPLTLSGGEAQRAGLARAIVRAPELLLLDEPFAALDALTRLRMQDLVLRLQAHHRCAVLLVTHDVDEALRLADRILLLRHGRVGLDLPVEAARPRRQDDQTLATLRRRLLGELGVPPEMAAA